MTALWATWWPEIVLTLITAGCLALCRNFGKKLKEYKEKEKNEESRKLDERIDEKLAPIVEEIEELRTHIRNTEEEENKHITLIISSYKYRLVQLCKLYLKQGYITEEQYEQISEFYKLYRALGGNGQAEDYWERIQHLKGKEQK